MQPKKNLIFSILVRNKYRFMSGFELNKLVASILLAALIAMLVGTLVNILYKPSLNALKRGYEIEVSDDEETQSGESSTEEEIDIASIMLTANAEAGKGLVKKCIACHSLGSGEPHKIGPNLWNTYNAAKGAKSDYKYSSALLAKGGKWDDESLFHFIHKPKAYIKGTKMSFIGFKKLEDVADMVAYLKTLAD